METVTCKHCKSEIIPEGNDDWIHKNGFFGCDIQGCFYAEPDGSTQIEVHYVEPCRACNGTGLHQVTGSIEILEIKGRKFKNA